MAQLITGLFHDKVEAERAVSDLRILGFQEHEISVMISDQEQAHAFVESTGTKAAEGAGMGAGIGGALGAILAALTATGSMVAIAATGGMAAPLVAGPLAAALAGAGAGGLTGGVIGGLIGAGIPEDRARSYEQGLSRGGILLGVYAESDQVLNVRQVLERDGADDVQGADGAALLQGNTAVQTDFVQVNPPDSAHFGHGVDIGPRGDREDWQAHFDSTTTGPSLHTIGDTPERIPLREEELTAHVHEVPISEVTVRKETITETRTIDVPVTREEVVIEQHPVGTAALETKGFSPAESEIRIPIMEEEVTIEKTPIVIEEVEVGTRRVVGNQHLTGTIRHEELYVEDDNAP